MPVEATDFEPPMTQPLTSILPITLQPRFDSGAMAMLRGNARLDPAPQPHPI
jgi:hypothetical protein